jgi:hypothetical protein
MDPYDGEKSIFFDEFEDTNNAKRANMLRAQLAIVDRFVAVQTLRLAAL